MAVRECFENQEAGFAVAGGEMAKKIGFKITLEIRDRAKCPGLEEAMAEFRDAYCDAMNANIHETAGSSDSMRITLVRTCTRSDSDD